jgi:hypothetical protein
MHASFSPVSLSGNSLTPSFLANSTKKHSASQTQLSPPLNPDSLESAPAPLVTQASFVKLTIDLLSI